MPEAAQIVSAIGRVDPVPTSSLYVGSWVGPSLGATLPAGQSLTATHQTSPFCPGPTAASKAAAVAGLRTLRAM